MNETMWAQQREWANEITDCIHCEDKHLADEDFECECSCHLTPEQKKEWIREMQADESGKK